MYFGPVERRRFAFLHEPAQPRAAVLMCPPLGYEAVCAHAALLQLAEQLAGRDITSMRMEYDGTGNSIGNSRDPDRVGSWITSVHDALDELTARGYPQITLLGLRVGALLAGVAAQDRAEVRRLVLWDPLLSGRHYSRRLKMLAVGETGGRDGNDILVGGVRFTGETLSGLGTLRMPAAFPAASTLVVAPADSPAEDLGDRSAQPMVQVVTMAGTPALLDTEAEDSQVPYAILTQITEWLSGDITADECPENLIRTEALNLAGEQHGGSQILHEAVRIGPRGLFATITRPAQGTPTRCVIMLNNGVAPQVGPGRAWVDWSLELASHGWSAVRLDLNGLGDSPASGGMSSRVFYPAGAAEDIQAATDYARSHGARGVALVGLCSGALLSFEGLRIDPDIDAIASINARFDSPPVEPGPGEAVESAAGRLRRAAFSVLQGRIAGIRDRIPPAVWRLLDWVRLMAFPARLPASVRGHRARILLLFGDNEWGLKALRRRGGRELKQAIESGQCTLVEAPGVDHSMFGAGSRESAFEVVLQFLDENVPASPGTVYGASGDQARSQL